MLIPHQGLSVLSPAQPAEVPSLNGSFVKILMEGSRDQLHKPRLGILADAKAESTHRPAPNLQISLRTPVILRGHFDVFLCGSKLVWLTRVGVFLFHFLVYF